MNTDFTSRILGESSDSKRKVADVVNYLAAHASNEATDWLSVDLDSLDVPAEIEREFDYFKYAIFDWTDSPDDSRDSRCFGEVFSTRVDLARKAYQVLKDTDSSEDLAFSSDILNHQDVMKSLGILASDILDPEEGLEELRKERP